MLLVYLQERGKIYLSTGTAKLKEFVINVDYGYCRI